MNSEPLPCVAFKAALTRGSFTLDATFDTSPGITALFGPSGSGKTTILHLIAGLLRPDRGKISLERRVLSDTDDGIFVPKHKRRIGLVYQDAQLFPHMSVGQNLRFARWFAANATEKLSLDAVCQTLGISHLLERRPPGLSGGERQRAALARALLSNPQLLLMDEPLAGLDADRRQDIIPLISRTRDEFGIPTLYVTHNVDEVRALADNIILLNAGRVTARGPAGAMERLLSAPPASAVPAGAPYASTAARTL